VETLHLQLKADQMRLSNVLELKKIFEKYPGKQKVKIEFKQPADSKAFVEISSEYGISIEANLLQELESLPFYYGVFVLD